MPENPDPERPSPWVTAAAAFVGAAVGAAATVAVLSDDDEGQNANGLQPSPVEIVVAQENNTTA